jgi:hypothetical protein
MSNEITIEMLDRTIAWCEQNAFWGKGSAICRMQDFYYEKTRSSVKEDWPESFNGPDLAKVLNVERVSYRIYYSKDNLTLRVFVFRPRCTWHENKTMLDLGFVHAQEGDTENIPDQPQAEEENETI